MLKISERVFIPMTEIIFQAVRAQGAGGQNVNKVSTAIHLRFNIKTSSLPEFYKNRLLNLRDRRISSDGIVIIKAQQYRSQLKNKESALSRLCDLVKSVSRPRKIRKMTQPTRASKKKRLDDKTKRGQKKYLRSGRLDYS